MLYVILVTRGSEIIIFDKYSTHLKRKRGYYEQCSHSKIHMNVKLKVRITQGAKEPEFSSIFDYCCYYALPIDNPLQHEPKYNNYLDCFVTNNISQALELKRRFTR